MTGFSYCIVALRRSSLTLQPVCDLHVLATQKQGKAVSAYSPLALGAWRRGRAKIGCSACEDRTGRFSTWTRARRWAARLMPGHETLHSDTVRCHALTTLTAYSCPCFFLDSTLSLAASSVSIGSSMLMEHHRRMERDLLRRPQGAAAPSYGLCNNCMSITVFLQGLTSRLYSGVDCSYLVTSVLCCYGRVRLHNADAPAFTVHKATQPPCARGIRSKETVPSICDIT